MHGLRYRVLGPVEVLRGEDGLRLPTGHQRDVLACLLAHAGRPVPADVLIEAAWPQELPADPRGALHTVVSRLRTTLGEGALTSDGNGYRLCPAPGAVDAQQLEQLRAEARRAEPARAAELLAAARSLWRGPAYGELAERGAVAEEAARLDRLRTDTAEELAVALRACGRPADAAAVLEELLAEDPFRERAVELLMAALHEAGRPSAALACFRSYRDLLAEELGLDPGPMLLTQQERILGRRASGPPSAGSALRAPRTVPAWVDVSSSFIGREREQQELLRRVGTGPAVTVVGPGGVGKTRLVAETVPELMQRHGAAIVVELARTGPGRVARQVARALGISGGDRTVQEDVVDLLGSARLLLVLDNCEHVRQEAARLAEDILGHCPGVRIVATSRHRLDLAAEQVLQLAPFAAPVTEEEDDPAVRLFTDRITRVRPGSGARESTAVRRLCRRLDGLPLAIELAASRAATIGVDAVADLLAQRPGHSLPELDAVVDWSVHLLTGPQRDLLCHLTVFAGAFDRDAVLAVAPLSGTARGSERVVADLAELIDAHLVVRRGTEGSDRRDRDAEFGMAALVRARAAQLLEESGKGEQARAAHARWVAVLLQEGARAWSGGGTAAASRRLTAAVPDIAAALRWTLRTDRLEEAAAVAVPFELHMHWIRDETLSDLVIEVAERCAADPRGARATAAAAGALACAGRGMIPRAQRLARLALARDLPPEGHVLARLGLAVAALYEGDLHGAARWARTVVERPDVAAGHRADAGATLALALGYSGSPEESREAVRLALLGAQAAAAEAAHAFALYASAELEVVAEPERAAALLREAAARAVEIDAQHIAQVSRLALFAVLARTREHEEAIDLAAPLLHDIRRAGAWPQAWTTVRLVAELLLERDRLPEAALLLSAADQAPEAPPLIAADAARGLQDRLREALGAETTRGIAEVAAGLSRTQILDRTAALIREERDAR